MATPSSHERGRLANNRSRAMLPVPVSNEAPNRFEQHRPSHRIDNEEIGSRMRNRSQVTAAAVSAAASPNERTPTNEVRMANGEYTLANRLGQSYHWKCTDINEAYRPPFWRRVDWDVFIRRLPFWNKEKLSEEDIEKQAAGRKALADLERDYSKLRCEKGKSKLGTDRKMLTFLIVDDFAEGYPRLAAYQSSDPSFTIFRKFDIMSTRWLLYQQSHLGKLEKQQNAFDKEYAADNIKRKRLRGWDIAADDGTLLNMAEDTRIEYLKDNDKQKAMMEEIRKSFVEYGKRNKSNR
jgi:hypothetical protein